MLIPEIKQERLYQKIANLIIKLINDNVFPPGSFLPPERELAKQLGVSRSSLREALIVQSGNGIIVSDNKHSPVDYTIEEILYVRDLVDSHCARLAALANNETIINKIELLHFRMENSIHENNVAEFYMLDKQFHLTISEASHNRVLLDMSRMLWEQRVNIPYAGLDKRSGDKNVLIKLNQQHKAIIEAIRAGNADNALQRALLHLKYVREIIGY